MSTIQGVHVLYEYNAFGNLKSFMLFLLIVVTALTFGFIIEPFFDKSMRKLSRIIGIVVLVAFCIFGWHVTLSMPNDHYIKATISDDVSAEELLKRYEVVSTEGEIYKLKVLEEKKNDNLSRPRISKKDDQKGSQTGSAYYMD